MYGDSAQEQSESVNTVAFSQEGGTVCWQQRSQCARAVVTSIATLSRHTESINAVTFNPDR